jgi:hypothetical protein
MGLLLRAPTIRLKQRHQLLSLLCVSVIWGICLSLKANRNSMNRSDSGGLLAQSHGMNPFVGHWVI